MKQKRKIFPKEFTKGMKEVGGDFLWGIWDGMSPGLKPRSKAWQRKEKKES